MTGQLYMFVSLHDNKVSSSYQNKFHRTPFVGIKTKLIDQNATF